MRTAEEVEVMARIRAANARTAEVWFEIWQEVVEAGIFFMVTNRPDKETVYENLRSRRPIYKRIKLEFKAMALDLTEKFLISGMDQDPDGTWRMKGSQITIALRTRKEKVVFKGEDAQVAFAFFTWWHSFKQSINPASIAPSGILH